jgi:predicted O-methyltransferase YrrM
MKTKQEIYEYVSNVGFDCNHFNPKSNLTNGGIHLQQHIDEYVDMLEFLTNLDTPIKTFLEVGAASGGNTHVLANILNLSKVAIVDDNSHTKFAMRKETLKNIPHDEFVGNSQGPEAKEFINKLNIKFDFVYIDADHSFEGVTKDFNNFKEFVKVGGHLGFHDAGTKGLPQLFEEVVSKDDSFKMVFDVFHRFGNRIYKKVK